MSKFKVGDRVKVIGDTCRHGQRVGEVIEIEGMGDRFATPSNRPAWGIVGSPYYISERDIEPIKNRHSIHITCTDGKTTHAVKKVDGKIVARSKAVCCPSDTFDFAVGANLVYDRLMRPEVFAKYTTETVPEQPKQEDKHTYKAGDRVKATRLAPSGEVGTVLGYAKRGTHFDCDVLVEFDSPISEGHDGFGDTDTRGKQGHCYYCFEKWLEPYTEPKQEPVKLYCVEDYEKRIKRGDVGCFDPKCGGVIFGDIKLSIISGHESFDEWKKHNPFRAPHFVPLVSRAAKVGEYVLITADSVDGTEKGEICEVVDTNSSSANHMYLRTKKPTIYGHPGITPRTLAAHSEYLVLDGYKPEPEPEKSEPEYYNGKVVCVDSAGYCHTVGKTYAVVDGFLIDDSGTKVPYLTGPVTSVDDLNSRSACKFAVLLDE